MMDDDVGKRLRDDNVFGLEHLGVDMSAFKFDVADEMRKKTASDIASGTDAIIAKAILLACGQAWTLIDVAGRVRSERYQGATFQTIFLDDEPILELHDGTFETEHGPISTTLRYNQNYRFLGKAAHSTLPSKAGAPQATGSGPDNTDIDLAFQYRASPPDKGQTE